MSSGAGGSSARHTPTGLAWVGSNVQVREQQSALPPQADPAGAQTGAALGSNPTATVASLLALSTTVRVGLPPGFRVTVSGPLWNVGATPVVAAEQATSKASN